MLALVAQGVDRSAVHDDEDLVREFVGVAVHPTSDQPN